MSNPLYIGEIDHKGLRHHGQHAALIGRDRWDAVQAQLAANRYTNRAASNTGSTNLLRGLLYDQSGNSLVSSYTTKNGKRYRYYVISDGPGRHPRDPNRGKTRLSAAQVDELVCSSLRNFLTGKRELVSYLRARSWNATEIATALETASLCATMAARKSMIDRGVEPVWERSRPNVPSV